MAKKLKLAFAMGGGVSLGTFSGAALTQTIKELIVHGKNKDGKPYEEIEIDVLSGASAGAMSLSIMLRIFTGHKDVLHLLADFPYKCKLEVLESKITEQIVNEFGEGVFANLSEKKKRLLFDAQVAQDFQNYLWVYKADISKLAGILDYPNKTNQKPLINTGSLLDINWLVQMAQETIIPKAELEIQEDSLLAKRVLFAATLAQLEGEKISSVYDHKPFNDVGRDKLYNELYNTILSDAVNSYSHKSVRVFDVNFGLPTDLSMPNHPNRWVLSFDKNKLRTDDFNINGKKLFELNSKPYWAMLTATVLAAGAFPIGFEPVMLTRYGYELTKDAQSPKQDTIYSYVDGGTFNNEPINEAFRLASFLDSLNTGTLGKDYDRLLLFVDPLVTQHISKKIQPFYDKYQLLGSEVSEVNGLQKMLSMINPIISMLRDEGSVSELDKSIGIFNKFENRKKIKFLISNIIDFGLKDDISPENEQKINKSLKETIVYIENEIKKLYQRITIPSTSITLAAEIRRIILDEENKDFFKDTLIANIEKQGFKGDVKKDYDKFFVNHQIRTTYGEFWLKALFFVYLETVMDLIGKNEKVILVPIGPVKFENNQFQVIPLEGQRLQGFFGFFSEPIRGRDFEKGRVATKNVLSALGFITSPMQSFRTTKKIDSAEIEEIKAKAEAVIKKRLIAEILDNNIEKFKPLNNIYFKLAKNVLMFFKENDIIEGITEQIIFEKPEKIDLDLMIKVAKESYQFEYLLDSFSNNDIDTIQQNDGTYLIISSFAILINDWSWEESAYLQSKKYLKIVDNDNEDEQVIMIPMPSLAQIKNAVENYSNPKFILDLTSGDKNIEIVDIRKALEIRIANDEEIWEIKVNFNPLDIILQEEA